MLSESEIEKRKPLWTALSDLWLDTELQEFELNWMAAKMAESGFSLEELRHIYANEVAPAVYMNLLSPAGEWTGFDEQWLHDTIISALAKRGRLGRLWLKLTRKARLFATEDYWQDLEQRFSRLKGQS